MTYYEELEQLISANEGELLARIGTFAMRAKIGARPPTDRQRKEAGRTWLSNRKSDFRKAVCGSHTVRAYLSSARTQDRVMLVAAVADVVSSIVVGVAATAVAVLLMKEGLATLCEEPVE